MKIFLRAQIEVRLIKKRITNERCLWVNSKISAVHPWDGKLSVRFGSGREGLLALLRALGVGNGDVVLLPAFVPEGIVAPCRLMGLTINFYALSCNLDPNWDHFALLSSNPTVKFAILIHYFGISRDAERFATICQHSGVPFLEDLAHAQTAVDSPLGMVGDYTLYSLTKIAGVADGAILAKNRLGCAFQEPLWRLDPRRGVLIVMNFARMLVFTASHKWGTHRFWDFFLRVFGRGLNSYRILMWYFHKPTAMSGLSKWLLKRFPWDEAIARRVAHESEYRNGLDRKAFVHLLVSETKTHCAMGYPVFVEDRDGLSATLAKHGVHGVWFDHKWDHIPPDLIYEDARWAMKHHFLFPTAYCLTELEVKFVIRISNEWAAQPSRSGH